MTLRHIVMWKFDGDDETRSAHAHTFAEELTALAGQVPSLDSITCKTAKPELKNDYDLVLIADFADEHALAEYQKHPSHVAVAERIKKVVVNRAAIDFESQFRF